MSERKQEHYFKKYRSGVFWICSHGLQAVGRQRVPQDFIDWEVVRFLQQRCIKLHIGLRSLRRPATETSETEQITLP